MDGRAGGMNNFTEDLKFSQKASHEDFWNAIYKKAFPTMEWSKICKDNSQGQKLGIDRIIYLSSGKIIKIDEKKRRKDYEDILLEFISVDTTNAPGWMEKDLLIDFLAYAFMESKQCYLFPWELLRRAWMHFKNEWKNKFKIITAENENYKTHSVAVPTNILLSSIKNSMIIQL